MNERVLGLSLWSWAVIGGAGILTIVARQKAAAPVLPLGKYFSWEELTASTKGRELGLDNTPGPQEQAALQALVDNVLDPLHEHVGRPIRVNSAYRSPAINAAVGGARESQHMSGEATDIKVAGLTAIQLAEIIAARYPFDELIWYAPERGGHVHVSYSERRNRRRTLHAPARSAGYVAWTPARATVAGFGYMGSYVTGV